MDDWHHYYQAPSTAAWMGRTDSSNKERIHQWVTIQDPQAASHHNARGIALIGFACDEGVRRNHGRVGAAQGPAMLRKALANICLHASEAEALYDWGDVFCPDGNLEAAQKALALLVAKARALGLKPLVLGGGHETAWGHFQGLMAATPPDESLAIVNFDAHLDLRPLLPHKRGSSGTPFLQIAESCQAQQRSFDYTCLGLQKFANSQALVAKAAELKVHMVSAEDMLDSSMAVALKSVEAVIKRRKSIYVSLCLDVLSAAIAPGVSAVQAWGLLPWHIWPALRALFASGHVVGFDVVELAPPYDHNDMTARQAAHFVADALRLWR